MTTESATIVQRLWNYCNVLRDDGVSYGDYVEQLTYLLFLKMDDERAREMGLPSAISPEYNWASLSGLEGAALETHYRDILNSLGQGSGLIPVIFRKAQNRIQDPAKLRRLITLIEGETWMGLDMDVKGEIYEGLLEKNAQDTKSGAGQYFTPRPLIQAMVDVMAPEPGLYASATRRRAPAAFSSPPTITSPGITAPWIGTSGSTSTTRRCTAGRSWTIPRGCA